jgi:ribonuclease VapC
MGEREGTAAYLRLKALPVRRVDVSEGLLLVASRIKATYDLSVADAWIVATAFITNCKLVHKDPEFSPLKAELPLFELPLKPARARSSQK